MVDDSQHGTAPPEPAFALPCAFCGFDLSKVSQIMIRTLDGPAIGWIVPVRCPECNALQLAASRLHVPPRGRQ